MNGRIGRMPDTVLATVVAGIIALLVFPVPSALLDVLLPLQLGASAAVLVAALGARRPQDLSALPSILLLATLLRLGLNISTTRLVLARGDAGTVVAAFGDAVVAGNPLAGAVVFAVLTIAQYLVIARGAERVAQVGARFALDGLPGRQLAIDADVRSGLLDPEAARSRRASLASDSSFYGAMDGAMKFVRGDAIAGLCIVGVNLVGGLAVGLVQRGLSLEQATRTYLVLTVGDGLLAQIPALLNAIAAGLVVTRVADPEAPALGTLLARQVAGRGRALVTAGGLLAALGALPGLPGLAFVPVGGALAFGGLWRSRREREAPPLPVDPAPLGLRLHPDALRALGPVPPEEVAERARLRLQREYGLDVPPPAVTLSAAELPPAGWRVEVGEAPVARGVLVPGPGLPPDERLALACAAAWRRHAGPLLGVQAVSDRLSRLETTHPALLRAVVPRRIDVPRLARLLQRLLAEDVPVRDLAAVLEALAPLPLDAREAEQYRAVRRALGPLITHRLAPDGRADVVVAAASFEEALRREAGPAPAHVEDVVAAVRALRAQRPRAALLVAPDVRERAWAALGDLLPDVPIVGADELLPGTRVTPLAVVGE